MGKVEFVLNIMYWRRDALDLNWLLVSFRLKCINSFSLHKEVQRH